MVLIAHHCVSMPQRVTPHLSSSVDADDFNMMYPEPPQGMFSSTPMGMNVSQAAYYPRPAHEYPTTVAYDAGVMYSEAPPYGVHKSFHHGSHHHNPHHSHLGMMSPSLYPEEMDGGRGPSSNLSTASCGSAPSSTQGSPRSAHGQLQPVEWASSHGLPNIVGQTDYFAAHGTEYSFAGQGAPVMDEIGAFEYAQHPKAPGFVDPSLIHPMEQRAPMGMAGYESAYPQPPSAQAYPASPALTSGSPHMRNGSTSPFPNHNYPHPFSPFAAPVEARRQSIHSFHSVYSAEPPFSGDESVKEKQRCSYPECGKTFKDLKAHMLTHQTERPEKCPIPTCDYHTKGFARKYDKNRHTLTHYKGTMVCGFCPGSGSAAEKSFNRADVFKRHLTAVHGVEQTPPNSRKKAAGGSSGAAKKLTGYAPDATGKCSTCSATFSNAQDFYEHLDDCVLRIVQQEDPAEAINAKRLAEVEEDQEVHATLEKNNLPTTTMTSATDDDEDDEMLEDDAEEGDDASRGIKGSVSLSPTAKKSGVSSAGVQKSRGMTHSRGGVPMTNGKSRGRKSRRDYPSSWGFDKGQMTMKKRVMTVFDGGRRLAKDDMMLSTEHEVRVRLSDGESYVTDLDIQTMKRAEGFHGATDAEKGPWISDDPTDEQMRQMVATAGC